GRTLHELVQESLQDESSLTRDQFEESINQHLAAGSFRVVIVLDEAPAELVNLMGYLESVTTGLSLDLIAVHAYTVGGHQIAVPQRLDPDHQPEPALERATRRTPQGSGHLEIGVQPFREHIQNVDGENGATLTMLADWVEDLARVSAITPETYFSDAGSVILLPRFADQKAGLVSVWCYASGVPALSFWRSVFERRAAEYIDEVEALVGIRIGGGNQTKTVTPELLNALRAAYISGSTTAK
ncbi:MAG: hypothetical protein WAW17_33690, partial [Rhodococcus sp. (in: high G+C Gram-positive bacteria)]|uniref:hypothetical protein n=1 Tax=Rhodococcus sp. TaxID=1831 RepID=UPI003BAF1C76